MMSDVDSPFNAGAEDLANMFAYYTHFDHYNGTNPMHNSHRM